MSGVNRPLRPVPMVPDTVCKRTTCEGGALLTSPLAVRSLPWEAGTRGWVVPLAPLRPHPVIWNIPHDGELTTCWQNLLGGAHRTQRARGWVGEYQDPRHSRLSIHHGTQYSQQPDGGGAGFIDFIEGGTEGLSNWPKVTQPVGNRARTSARVFAILLSLCLDKGHELWPVLPQGRGHLESRPDSVPSLSLANSEPSRPFPPWILPRAHPGSERQATGTEPAVWCREVSLSPALCL